ncbi:helix-turn-helix domain-containing protein [Alterinioella nitratireducens]|uniref:helix-turn-helix domain-containing protein n=1 Tax=Alterinioella nitratireducens TaxID=2735915 RepID=UPI0015516742|nr:helix-turn-helix domain-containing protein [Alterinioella nitratireducens]NPD20139.1 GntR family transcriptional regulator [Alterinioella nitratireducens]
MAKSTTSTPKTRTTPKPSPPKSSTERIFGAKVLSHGYTGIPNILLRGQKRLGINATQLNIIAQLLSYWINPERPPFPSKRELAGRIGITEQTLRINIKALEERGLVMREQRVTAAGDYGSNTYHLNGLVKRLKEMELDFEEERKERQAARKLTEKPNARANARTKRGQGDGGTE